MEYDACIILSHEVKEDGGLSKETKERVDCGIELSKRGFSDYLIMSGAGWKGHDFTHAECMADYALEEGISGRRIILEDVSLETVGQLVFSKEGVIEPRGFEDIVIITHDYHIPKVKCLAYFLFGTNYNLDFMGVDHAQSEEKDFGRKILNFLKSVGKSRPEPGQSFLDILVERHSWYHGGYPYDIPGGRKDKDFFREELVRLISQNS